MKLSVLAFTTAIAFTSFSTLAIGLTNGGSSSQNGPIKTIGGEGKVTDNSIIVNGTNVSGNSDKDSVVNSMCANPFISKFMPQCSK